MPTCDLCKRDAPTLEFNCVGCRVRYLRRLPSKNHRVAQVEYWNRKRGKKYVDETVKILRSVK